MSYYHTVTIYDNQVAASLLEPKVFEVIEQQVRSVEKLLSPKTYFLSHDEIRIANWDQASYKPGRSAGEVLAENVRRCVEIVRKVNPDARIVIWSDMFDPHHNAVKGPYYLVNGSLTGSWEGLNENVTIINWNSGKAKESLSFFAKRGHSQILAGYYDHNPAQIRKWLDAGKDLEGIDGVMYTTWRNNFKDLEAFARHAWGGEGVGSRE